MGIVARGSAGRAKAKKADPTVPKATVQVKEEATEAPSASSEGGGNVWDEAEHLKLLIRKEQQKIAAFPEAAQNALIQNADNKAGGLEAAWPQGVWVVVFRSQCGAP